jgi:hypothetical protein
MQTYADVFAPRHIPKVTYTRRDEYSIKHALAFFFLWGECLLFAPLRVMTLDALCDADFFFRGKCLLFAPLRGMTLDAFCAAAEKDFVISREERYDIKV